MMSIKQVHCFASCLVLCLGLNQPGLQGAERRANGREIFRQQCAKCHGRTGDGVKGKYDDALQGDWSLEKLTRYIDKNMPDDAPEKCVGPDAEAVARYIYDAFYSREARARNHPARVELVRLTNRQYLNTVADLLRHFGDADKYPGNEHGLRGSYRKGRGGRRDGGGDSTDRTDRQINFDFNEKGPNGEPIGTNQFSLNWRGALIADENGEYEFIVKSPNGVRLWINDEDTALIDAGVASGDMIEHKASRRLIGGRAYPVRLEYQKAPKDKKAS